MSEHMVNSSKLIFALEVAPVGTHDGFVMQLDMYNIDANWEDVARIFQTKFRIFLN